MLHQKTSWFEFSLIFKRVFAKYFWLPLFSISKISAKYKTTLFCLSDLGPFQRIIFHILFIVRISIYSYTVSTLLTIKLSSAISLSVCCWQRTVCICFKNMILNLLSRESILIQTENNCKTILMLFCDRWSFAVIIMK